MLFKIIGTVVCMLMHCKSCLKCLYIFKAHLQPCTGKLLVLSRERRKEIYVSNPPSTRQPSTPAVLSCEQFEIIKPTANSIDEEQSTAGGALLPGGTKDRASTSFRLIPGQHKPLTCKMQAQQRWPLIKSPINLNEGDNI